MKNTAIYAAEAPMAAEHDIDVEFVLRELPAADADELARVLPEGYELVDRGNKGWGHVVRNSEQFRGELSTAIERFLTPLTAVFERPHTPGALFGLAYSITR